MDQFALTLDGFIPHGVCLLWQAGLVYLHVGANALIALAYFSIPFAIFHFVRRRPDIHFKFLHWQFAAFILLCGLTHVMGIVVLWWPLYWLQGAVMAATALISLFAAALLWKLMPSLLGIPSADKLQEINSRLQQEIAEKNQLMETLRRETQRMESLSQEKSAFLSNVSHEIRTPMNGIIGIADLLEDTHLDQEQQNFVHTIQQSAHTLLGLINDILDFSKIDAGKLELEHIAFDPLKIAENCVAIVAPRAYEKKLSLVCHTAPDLPRAVLGDPTRITQILLNLLNNAIKFTPQGEVVLRVDSEAADGAKVWLRFAVADTGIGIAAGQIDRLFEPFTQADASTSRHFGGTGLGLSICKRLAELMGGRIGVDSREKLGSTFWVSLPFPLAESPAPAVAPDNLPPVVWLAGGSAALRASLNTLLARWGCRVAESSLAEWSAERWADAADQPLLLLLEQQDRAVLLKLAKQAKSLAGNRVALVLSAPDAEAAAECKAAGIACTVQPVTGKNLAELLAPPPPSSVPAPGGEAKPAISASAALDSGQLILLAEDNRVNQVVALSLLKKLGYTAHVVENGEEAVAAVGRLPYGLVLMDCQMPVMDGFAATQAIRQREIASGKHIPIVAMTANAMAGDREQCLAAGMDDYLSKPVGFVQLKQVLEAWLPANAPAAETAQPLQQPVMDWSRLRDYFDDDEAGMRETLAVFLRTLPERGGQLLEAVARQDSERCQFILNDFLASSEGIGAARLAELLQRVQADAGQKRWEALANIEALLAEQQGLLAALLPQSSSTSLP